MQNFYNVAHRGSKAILNLVTKNKMSDKRLNSKGPKHVLSAATIHGSEVKLRNSTYSKQACGDDLLGGHLCSVKKVLCGIKLQFKYHYKSNKFPNLTFNYDSNKRIVVDRVVL
ncbi:hypothetical protein BpHYR1_035228 [Brachionus plicatilis]|uniref:Uncharacterized protein n=1 Tax=Brachionus plicatilis TaxID=10195 RepID=A0A3M7T964_BRAPC|nr:hypothetical protein BpHYR1_035228 [Brachionus plicatilis]